MIEVGLKGYKEIMVTDENTAAALGNKGVDVFATPFLVSLCEFACAECLLPFLEEGQGTVGVIVNVTHMGATPVGHKVWCESEVISVNKGKIEFKVEIFDEQGMVGKGTHLRAIIPVQKFLAGVEAKWANK